MTARRLVHVRMRLALAVLAFAAVVPGVRALGWAQAPSVPRGLDLHVPAPADDRPIREAIARGRRLFSDRRLSADGSISCATCHDPARAFSGSTPLSTGVFGRTGNRNVPAIINRAWGQSFFWDGRVATLEDQVLRPIEAHDEMGSSAAEAAARVGLTVDELSHALASYVRSILAGDSPYDQFVDGEADALSDDARAGLRVFRGQGRCTSCHLGPTFTDELFHNTGIAWDTDGQRYLDPGRWLVTGAHADRGAFKTPTLREVARTAPYMHDGSLATLEDVVEFYDLGGRPNPNLDVDVRSLGLDAAEKRALVAFLRSLSGDVREGARR